RIEERKLEAPHGGEGAQGRADVFAAVTQQRGQRVEEREVSFSCSVLLDGPATRQHQARMEASHRPHELFSKRGLSNAGLAGQEHDFSGAAQHPLKVSGEPRQLTLAAYKSYFATGCIDAFEKRQRLQ